MGTVPVMDLFYDAIPVVGALAVFAMVILILWHPR